MKDQRILRVLVFFLTALLVFSFAGIATAKYPRKKIEWVCYSSPGGGSDRFTRTAVQDLEEILDTKIIVSNLPGGAGSRGVTYVMGKPADGHTLLTSTSTIY